MFQNILKSLILTVGLLITGCNQYEEAYINDTETIEEAVQNPQHGGTLHISMRSPKTLNPILNEDVSVDNVLKLIFEHLFILNEELRPIPNLAQSAIFSEDGTYAIITLRNDIFWADGTPLTAADLIFTLDTIRSNPNSIYAEVIENIFSYTQVDPLTVRVNFSNSSKGQGYMFLFPIIPRHYYLGQTNPSSQVNMTPLGNGPFMFESYTVVRELNLVANPRSFRQPYIQNVNVLITTDIETDFYALQHGIIEVLNANIIDLGRHGGSISHLNITSTPKNHYDFLGFNFSKPIFQYTIVRQAIAHAIPKQDLIQSVYLSQAISTNSPINPISWLYEEDLYEYELDLNLSRSLMLEAGFIEMDNGRLGSIVLGEVVPLSLNILVNEENVERVQIANILRQNLENIGININLMVYNMETYIDYIDSRNFDLVLGGFNLSVKPNLSFAFHSSQINRSNIFSYSSDTMDTLLESIRIAPNEILYKQAIRNLQKYINQELPVISIAFRTSVLLTNSDIKGEIHPSLNNIYQNIHQWFIIEEDTN